MEVKKKITNVLKSKKGSTAIWTTAVIFFLLVVLSIGFEYIRLQIIAQGTRDVMESVITQACTNNYEHLFNGLREGYSGGYKFEKGTWSEDINVDDAYEMLDQQLNTQRQGLNHVKYNGNTIELSISDLQISMTNTPFAPQNSDRKFAGIAHYTVTVPLSFGWQKLPPMVIPMEVKAGYSPKF